MNIALPESLESFVDEQVATRGYGNSSEHVRELIPKDQDRTHLRELLLDGAASEPTGAANEKCFEGLRDTIRQRANR